jgi:Clr5 domain
MDLDNPSQGVAGAPSQVPQKGPILSRNDQKWESLKKEIHRVYMAENMTLPHTMLRIEAAHSFKAS